MNEYSKFVKASFSIISEVLPSSDNPASIFAYGEVPNSETNGLTDLTNSSKSLPSEYAYLLNKQAYIYYGVLISHSSMFGIDTSAIRIRHSQLIPDAVAIGHNCYSKNVNRWMNGQKSRKTINRAEYVTLLYCWAMNWFNDSELKPIHKKCVEELRQLCADYLSQEERDNADLLSVLWRTSKMCYEDSYSVLVSPLL